MAKLNPKTAEQNPLAAALLGATLAKQAQQTGSSAQKRAGLDLLKAAKKAAEVKVPPKGGALAAAIEKLIEQMEIPAGPAIAS